MVNFWRPQRYVIIIVSHQSHWKIPITYFFTRSLSGRNKSNFVNQSLVCLFEVGTITMSITVDGPFGNFAILIELGSCLEGIYSMKTFFSIQQIHIEKFTAFWIIVICWNCFKKFGTFVGIYWSWWRKGLLEYIQPLCIPGVTECM